MALKNSRIFSCHRLQSILQENIISCRHLRYLHKRAHIYNSRFVCASRYPYVTASTNVSQLHSTRCHSTSSGSVSTKELEKFQSLAQEWWKSDGEYAALRSLNKLRVPLIKEVLGRNGIKVHDQGKPLSNLKVLDVGCGGGILAEPLARLGADVFAIDAVEENIEVAKAHIRDNKDFERLVYECATIEDISERSSEQFDLVVASEVLEHVENTSVFVQDCCRAIKPGGKLVITTINRTILSTLLVKYAAEYLLRIVPQGTHDENKFITPDELVDMLRESGMVHINLRGMLMNPLTYHWSWAELTSMNYACYATKPS